MHNNEGADKPSHLSDRKTLSNKHTWWCDDDDDDDDEEDDAGGWQDVLTDLYKSGAGAKASQRAPCFSN